MVIPDDLSQIDVFLLRYSHGYLVNIEELLEFEEPDFRFSIDFYYFLPFFIHVVFGLKTKILKLIKTHF